jgi:hypothetical protein
MDVTNSQEREDTATPRPDPLIFYEWVSSSARAKVALADTLQEVAKGRGFVRPVTLAHDGDDWTYARFSMDCQATYVNGAVTWR